nr:DUF2520 domain-containing protein [uncultured Carboxylicivirga sp.]
MRIVLIGSGNVATHLGNALYEAGHKIVQVYSRSKENAINLSASIESTGITDLSKIDTSADIYIISVKDDALSEVAELMPKVEGLVVHTAGSVEIEVLSVFENYGVLYPFQTFTKASKVNFGSVPVLVESNTEKNTETLLNLGHTLSKNVLKADSKQRAQLHIAAVYSCNFVNLMYRLADDVLQESGLPFSLLQPLILETANKVQALSPSETQTGPASRDDQQTILKHKEVLADHNELSEIYNLLTDSILKRIK